MNKMNVILNEAVNSSTKRKSRNGKNNRKLNVWNENIAIALHENRTAHREWKMNCNPNDREHPLFIRKKRTKLILRSEIRKKQAQKRISLHTQILDARCRDTKLFHELIKRQR